MSANNYQRRNQNYPPRRRKKKKSFIRKIRRMWRRRDGRKKIITVSSIILVVIIAIVILIVSVSAKNSDEQQTTQSAKTTETTTVPKTTADKEDTTVSETTTANVITHHDVMFTRDEIDVYDDEIVGTYDTSWHICVNLSYNVVIIYKVYDDGSEEPVKSMICSVGREWMETSDGEFYLGEAILGWCYMADGTYGQYSFRIIDGVYNTLMFHAIPYYAQDRSTLVYEEFNMLGTAASMGCVRLMMKDAIWLVSHVGPNTPVSIYYADSYNEPLPRPEAYFIPPKVWEINGWDPTDPLSSNPWHSYEYSFDIPDSITVPLNGTSDDIYNSIVSNVTATDIYGYDLAEYTTYTGDIDTSVAGYYPITAYLKIGPITAQKYLTVIVE